MAGYSQYGPGLQGGEDYGYEDQSQQRPPPEHYNIRPMVDPEAEGEVDPNL
jgi:hypothetical protein